jgi:hypothetical protein
MGNSGGNWEKYISETESEFNKFHEVFFKAL